MSERVRFVSGFVFALLLAAASASAQNLVSNPDFTSNLNNWAIVNGGSGSGSTVFDLDSGSPAGGGARAQFSDTGSGGTNQGLSQCVNAVPGSLPWVFGGRFAVVSDTNVGGGNTGFVLVQAFSGPNCTLSFNNTLGSPGGTTAGVIDGIAALYTQHSGSFAADPLPGGSPTQSIRIQALIQTDTNGDVFEGVWDKIFFGPNGTTPVTLLDVGVQ